MKAFVLLAQSILEKARRKGFDILLLLAFVVGLVYWNVKITEKSDALGLRWESKLDTINAQWSTALNESNRRILECERDKYDLSLRVAVLEYQLGASKHKKR